MRQSLLIAGLGLLMTGRPATSAEYRLEPLVDNFVDHGGTSDCGRASPNADADTTLTTSTREAIGRASRVLVRFDLSSFPGSTQIASATLRLFAVSQNEYLTNDLHVSQVTEDWNTAEITWCDRSSGNLWCSPGICFTNLNQTQQEVVGKFPDPPHTGPYGEWVEMDVTQIVHSWIVGGSPNWGFSVWQTPLFNHGRNQILTFASKEYSQVAGKTPQLVIQAEVPGACCIPHPGPTDDGCLLMTESNCALVNGVFLGVGTPCVIASCEAITGVGETAVRQNSFLATPQPNPLSGTMAIVFTLDRAQDLDVFVTDILGRVVQSRDREHFGLGSHILQWNLDLQLPSGIYYVHLASSREHLSKKFVLLR